MIIVDAKQIDHWADDLLGPVALHIRQKLISIEGEDGVIFPPTYAMKENRSDLPYAIDVLRDGRKVVQIDSVGSQANRMEPLFQRASEGNPKNPLADLVPQIEIVASSEFKVSILQVGHRLGDALIRSSELHDEAKEAFAAFSQSGDATAIARLAPTSLVFGVWDSRGEQAKSPRIVQSVIRGWDVDPLRRSAQYVPAMDYAKAEVFTEEDKQKAEGDSKNPLAQQGFVHVPAVDSHGGVVVHGGIYRDVIVNLVALRQLSSPKNATILRRYILGLALVAATQEQDGFLRQGCLLTPDPDVTATWTLVERSGKRLEITLDHGILMEYAGNQAKQFGIAEDRCVRFERELARADVAAKSAKKKTEKKKT
ncbi:MAG: type I-G CRISPR-associated RAMP protein Csb1/Cas7g [Acidithiobacillus ferrivorans]